MMRPATPDLRRYARLILPARSALMNGAYWVTHAMWRNGEYKNVRHDAEVPFIYADVEDRKRGEFERLVSLAWRYESDGRLDWMQSPKVFAHGGFSGDCDDQARWAVEVARWMGWSARVAFIFTERFPHNGSWRPDGHAIAIIEDVMSVGFPEYSSRTKRVPVALVSNHHTVWMKPGEDWRDVVQRALGERWVQYVD